MADAFLIQHVILLSLMISGAFMFPVGLLILLVAASRYSGDWVTTIIVFPVLGAIVFAAKKWRQPRKWAFVKTGAIVHLLGVVLLLGTLFFVANLDLLPYK